MKRTGLRRVTYVCARGEAGQQFALLALDKTHWFVWDWSTHQHTKLRDDEEGVRWSWGWKSKAARALYVKAALT